jgi:hypothetical protein
MWELLRLTVLWVSTACYRNSFILPFCPLSFHISWLVRKLLCIFTWMNLICMTDDRTPNTSWFRCQLCSHWSIYKYQTVVTWQECWVAWTSAFQVSSGGKKESYEVIEHKTKLHGLSPRANYTDRATAACRRSDCQLLQEEGATWSAWRIPPAVFSVF